ncbi:MAG: WecB/TagA/CpsF family glycosyltransferase, partial [Symbiobacteriaceae bacterium]
ALVYQSLFSSGLSGLVDATVSMSPRGWMVVAYVALLPSIVAQMTYAQGVGGGFDVLAGVARRAPTWVQRAGLEGVYRLLLEPRKRWRRVIVDNARFLAMVWRSR